MSETRCSSIVMMGKSIMGRCPKTDAKACTMCGKPVCDKHALIIVDCEPASDSVFPARNSLQIKEIERYCSRCKLAVEFAPVLVNSK